MYLNFLMVDLQQAGESLVFAGTKCASCFVLAHSHRFRFCPGRFVIEFKVVIFTN